MDDPLSMGLVERFGHLDRVAQRLVERKSTFFQPLRQRFALDVLHDEVVDTVLLADVIECANVRMVQARDRAGFTLEALTELDVIGEVLGKHLDRHDAIESGVFCLVDLTHTARSER